MRTVTERVLGLMLVGLLVVSAAGLAASQTFINKTGKTVTGIRIEFSRSVTITRHDSAFLDQSPSGRSDEFTFSGGDLRNLGRFSITWMPSSAKVTGYEWIEKAQPAPKTPTTTTQQEEEFKLPDPNTPPILYGDDYPGPDEPLYQPEPDEQIWLTDLEGHGDIYDNDSIKINYAPGFDKSQITKIDVYRNGIKLRFVPQKIDVLTNAQMKTFDGNPAEHSPASNHTDHAIMGYEYKFKISTADHLWIMTKIVKSGFRWRPKEVWAQMGISWEWFKIDGIPFSDLVQFLEYLKADGFTGISLGIPYHMDTPYDNDVFPVYDPYSKVCYDEEPTPTTSELEKMLKALEAAKMDVHVRGDLYISQAYQDEHGSTFWGDIDPSNPEEFFDNYTQLWLKLVPLFNKYHVKLITPFTECDELGRYGSSTKKMYTTISQVYEGKMGWEEPTSTILEGESVINHEPIHTSSKFAQIVKDYSFWNWTGLRGQKMRYEMSVWTPPLETQKDQKVSVMERNFVKFLSIPVGYYGSKYPGIEVMFGEIGAYNADGYVLGSDYYKIPPNQRVLDEQERADYILAALKGSKALGIMAINVWGDFYNGDFAPRLGCASISTGHYGYPASPMYRTIKAIIQPAD